MRCFSKMKPLQNGEITDVGKSGSSQKFINIANMSFNVVPENKIIAKISLIYSNKLVVFTDIHVTMRRSRKFCQRGSNTDNVFFS